VPTYNGRKLLEVIVPSLMAQSHTDFELIVVDDASSDDSRSYLAEHWPQARVIANRQNVGVAAAINLGVAAAQGDYVALLNNDLELDPGWLHELVSVLDRHPEAGTASCKLLNYWRRNELDGAGDIFCLDGTAYRRGHGDADRGQYELEQDVFAPTAGAGLYRSAALSEVGPFDESFFMYFEDVDWGLRAQLLGYRCLYVPSAIAYHMGGETTAGESNPRYFVLQRRNLLAVLIKDAPALFLLQNLPRVVFAQLRILRRSVRARRVRLHARAFAEMLSQSPRWWRARRSIQRHRRISAREFNRMVRYWSSHAAG
jgi:hypothetical protein